MVPKETIKELRKMGIHEVGKDSALIVKGHFKEIEGIYLNLSKLERKPLKNEAHKVRSFVNHHAAPGMKSTPGPPVEAVEIDAVVMDYIKQKHSTELAKIKQPGVELITHKRQVMFYSRDPTLGMVQAQFARERFITFYQKIATTLQNRVYKLDTNQMHLLHKKFPELLVTEVKQGVILTGSYLDLERFERFLHSPPPQKHTSYRDNAHATVSSQPSLQNAPNDKEEICCICLETLVKSQSKTLEKCKHSFCRDCLRKAFEIKPVCPTCGVLYGALKGTQPEGGTMKNTVDPRSLRGYESYGTIVIHYYIPSGTQGVSMLVSYGQSFLLSPYCMQHCVYVFVHC